MLLETEVGYAQNIGFNVAAARKAFSLIDFTDEKKSAVWKVNVDIDKIMGFLRCVARLELTRPSTVSLCYIDLLDGKMLHEKSSQRSKRAQRGNSST